MASTSSESNVKTSSEGFFDYNRDEYNYLELKHSNENFCRAPPISISEYRARTAEILPKGFFDDCDISGNLIPSTNSILGTNVFGPLLENRNQNNKLKTEAIIFTEVNKKLSKLEDTTTQVQKNNFTDMDNKPRKNKKKNKVIEKPNNSRQTPANETVDNKCKGNDAAIFPEIGKEIPEVSDCVQENSKVKKKSKKGKNKKKDVHETNELIIEKSQANKSKILDDPSVTNTNQEISKEKDPISQDQNSKIINKDKKAAKGKKKKKNVSKTDSSGPLLKDEPQNDQFQGNKALFVPEVENEKTSENISCIPDAASGTNNVNLNLGKGKKKKKAFRKVDLSTVQPTQSSLFHHVPFNPYIRGPKADPNFDKEFPAL